MPRVPSSSSTRFAWLLRMAFLASLTGGFPVADAFRVAASAHGAKLRWPTDEVTVEVRSLPSSIDPGQGHSAIARALSTWNRLDCGPRLRSVQNDQPGKIRIEVVDAERWPHRATIAAHTEVDAKDDTGVLGGATIRLQAGLGWDVLDPVAPDGMDFESVILHELGHALGLAHSYNRSSVMRAAAKPGQRRRALTEDDRLGACAPRQAGSRP